MESDRKILRGRGKLFAGILAAASVLSGCEGTPNQVNGVNLVDCQNGPKSGETSINLLKGSELRIGAYDGKSGNDVSSISIVSEGSDSLVIKNLNNDEAVRVLLSPDAQLQNNDVGIFAESGIIYVNSDGINYFIEKNPGDQGVTKMTIKATCQT